MKIFSAVLTTILVLFFGIMMIFRLLDGSFQSAGARMDRLLGVAATEASAVGEELAAATEDIADDVSDGQDP